MKDNTKLMWRNYSMGINNQEAFLGNWQVFGIKDKRIYRDTEYNGKRFELLCSLPGIKTETNKHDTDEEAKQDAQRLMNMWLYKAGVIEWE